MLNQSEEELLSKIEQQACAIELQYHGCCQATLKAIQDHLGIGDLATFKAATPFAAGIARRGECCGALIAGLMAIGIEFGREDFDEPAVPQDRMRRALDLGAELFERFEQELGSFRCWDIQETIFGRHFDPKDPEVQKMKQAGIYRDTLAQGASKVAGKGARLAAEIILRERKKQGE